MKPRRGGRRVHKRRCPHHGKGIFNSYRRADRVRARLNNGTDEGGVYYCPSCGGYHISGSTQAEYDRIRGAYLAGDIFEGTLDNSDPNSEQSDTDTPEGQ